MQTKSIAYAYPSSPNAAKLGFNKTGCYTVEVLDAKTRASQSLAGFATFDEAEVWADGLKQPFDRWSMTVPRSLAKGSVTLAANTKPRNA